MSIQLFLVRHGEVIKPGNDGDPLILSAKGEMFSHYIANSFGSDLFDEAFYDEVDENGDYNRCFETIKNIKCKKPRATQIKKRGTKKILETLEEIKKTYSVILCFRGETFGILHQKMEPERYVELNMDYNNVFEYRFDDNKWIFMNQMRLG